MNISSLNFVMQQFESNGYRYFGIYDDEGMLVTYQNDVIDKGQALQKFRAFVRENTGFYTVMIFKSKLANINNLISRDKALEAKYNIQIDGGGQNQSIAGMTGQYQPSVPGTVSGAIGLGSFGGVSSLLPQDDPRNGAPNLWDMQKENANFRTEMLLMQKDHNHYRELKERDDTIARLQEEVKNAKGIGAVTQHLLDPATILGLVAPFFQSANGPAQAPRPINGIGSIESAANVMVENGPDVIQVENLQTENNTANDMEARPKDPKMQAIENAVRELIKSDPNFHLNIAKLAQIAQKSPAIYQMAVQYLKTL